MDDMAMLFPPIEVIINFPNKKSQDNGANILARNGGYSNIKEGFGCSISQLGLLDREKIPYERLK